MTEDEAKTKWCPMVREFSQGEGPANSHVGGRNPSYARCIASDCALWVRADKNEIDGNGFSALAGHCGLVRAQP